MKNKPDMMKQQYITFLLTVIMSMVGTRAFADWDTSTKIQVDGLYYYLDNENMQVEVTSWGSGSYMGNIEIPVDIVYEGKVYSVTSIGYEAFSDCGYLNSVTIPNSVTYIGNGAFQKCPALTTITIPNSVTYIGVKAFNGCTDLISMIVESGNIRYDSRENCNAIIETSTNKLISGCKNSFIPNSVASIGDNAFYNCTGLTSITIPQSVTKIGYSVFSRCTNLTDANIIVTDFPAFCNEGPTFAGKGNMTVHLLDEEGNEMTEFVIPDDVTSIREGLFANCRQMTSDTQGLVPVSLGKQ